MQDLLWEKLPESIRCYSVDLLCRLLLIDRADSDAAALLIGGMPPGSAAALTQDGAVTVDRRGIRVLTDRGRELVRLAAEHATSIDEIAAASDREADTADLPEAREIAEWLAAHEETWAAAAVDTSRATLGRRPRGGRRTGSAGPSRA